MTATATRIRATRPKTDEDAVRQIIAALLNAGYALDSVDYGDDEEVKVTTVDEAWDAIDAVDMATLHITHTERRDSNVLFVLGNDPEEVAANYGDSLTPVIEPVTDQWW